MQLILEKRCEDKLLEKTMCRLKPEQRLMLGKLARQDISKNVLMISFSVSRTTVWYWGKQNLHYISDLPRNQPTYKTRRNSEDLELMELAGWEALNMEHTEGLVAKIAAKVGSRELRRALLKLKPDCKDRTIEIWRNVKEGNW